MAFIGNQPFTAAFLTDTFSGNGSTVAFTMTVAPANTSSILVSVTGVLQSPDTYSVSGTTLTFSAAPPSGTSNISVRYLGIPASGVTTTAYRTVTNFTATAGQTSFSVPSYTVGYIDVYRNGVRLVSTDYTATTGTTVVLNNACTVGDSVVTESFLVSSVLNAIPATAGSVSDSYIVSMAGSKLTGTQSIPKSTLPTGSVLQVVQTSSSTVVTNTGTVSSLLSLSITPSSSSNKVLILTSLACYMNPSANALGSSVIYRGTTSGTSLQTLFGGNLTAASCYSTFSHNYLDSPSTTSAQTYTLAINKGSGGTTSQITENLYSLILMEIAA